MNDPRMIKVEAVDAKWYNARMKQGKQHEADHSDDAYFTKNQCQCRSPGTWSNIPERLV
jgi:hypothetical protein